MWDFQVGRALGMMLKTLPFIVFRLVVYFGVALAYVLMTGVGAGVGWGVGGMGDEGFRAASTFWGGVVGFGIVGAVMYALREYLLYLVKAGHIAVLVELIDGQSLPQGRGQIDHASSVVKERFGQASLLFGIDQLIKGVLRTITGLARGIFGLVPIPGARQFIRLIEAFLKIAVGFIDEVILAYCIRTGSTNAWASSRDALVLYGQNAKPMLKNAAWLALIVYGLSFVVFLVMLAPAAAVAYLIPGGWSATGVVVALLFAWSVKVAVLEPFAITCMMQAYFKVIEGQAPDAEWESKLDGMSSKFRKLKEKAVGGQPQGDAHPASE
ncbi:hypothetical protein C1H70_11125 [Halomonas urumqiensis]|uniref:Uncharacterized protein n=2 Tax=Halomonas urumqiensis TaxID=1684789 RepID=A0A2N7UGX7_9GAMM|nr:hypothetical protein C1H70_11125 [Halomonas urumqiensis]PTB03117.1 hypothetical protein C6V82_00955 [Halomonas urumqiensis]GHE20742.1 hypothetical protein GCM10017767_12630 [Halomonas urumqiensis]